MEKLAQIGSQLLNYFFSKGFFIISSSHCFFYPFQVAIASDSGIAPIRSVFILSGFMQPLSSEIRPIAFSSEAIE